MLLKRLFPICILCFFLSACNSDDDSASDNLNNNNNDQTDVVQKNGRTIAIDINEGSGDFNTAFALAQDMGINEVKQSWDWNELEKDGGFDFTYPDIVNIFFPAHQTPVSIILRPITVNLKTVPSDLQSVAFDDPQMIDRFKVLLDSVHKHIPAVDLKAVYIGNEIDIYLGNDQEKWSQFKRFFEETSAHARTLWGNSIKYGTIATLTSLKKDEIANLIKPLHDLSDIVAITYYPLEADFQFKDPGLISDDFDRIVELYGDKEIRFTECGYSTSTINGSSEEKQKRFIEEVFKSWDEHEAVIRHIDFTWMHDISQAKVDEFKDLFGLQSNTFGEYLRTLGLRTFDGEDKLGFVQLKKEAEIRGW